MMQNLIEKPYNTRQHNNPIYHQGQNVETDDWNKLLKANLFRTDYSAAAYTGHNGYQYHGLSRSGKNKGAYAEVSFASSTSGHSAENITPAFLNSWPTGYQRAHLIARCLGGSGKMVNWVPLQGGVNLAMFYRVEEQLMKFIRNLTTQQQAIFKAKVNVAVEYDYNIPIPSAILYTYQFFGDNDMNVTLDVLKHVYQDKYDNFNTHGDGDNLQMTRAIQNKLSNDVIQTYLRQQWDYT